MTKKNKIILIADANSFWTKRYIQFVLAPLGMDVILLSNTNLTYAQYYKDNLIRVISYFDNIWCKSIPYLRTLWTQIKMRKFIKKENPDFVNAFYVFDSTKDVLLNIPTTPKIILTYLGSDLFRSRVIKNDIKVLNKANHVVLMTKDMHDAFVERFTSKYDDKIKIIDMGVSVFTEIDKLRFDRETCRCAVLGENNLRKTSITIGYNASKEQQHDKVIKALLSNPFFDKSLYHFIIPLTYRNTNQDYLNSLKRLVSDCGISYTIFEKFLDDVDIAKLCLSTDIFINAQTTDALSSSMLEQIYSGSYILNADWLSYKPLIDMGIHCDTFHSFDELISKIGKYNSIKDDENNRNAEVLRKNCSWDSCRVQWEKLIF